MSTSEVSAEVAAPSRVGRVRWKIAGVLGIGAFVNYIDRVNLSIAAPEIMRDFDISAAQMGIVSSAFLWTYAVLQMPIGSVIDKIGVRWVNRVGVTLWALASFLSAAAGGLGLVIIARLILGIGEAPSVPAAWKAIGQWFPKQERGTATAIFDGSSKMSNVLGIPIMAFLVSAFSWHAAFIFTGVLSVVFLLVWWILYRTPKQALASGRLTAQEYALIRDGGAEDEDARTSGSLNGLGYLLRRRKTWGLTLGFASYTYAYYVLLTWLPGYLEKQFGVNLLKGGLYTMIPWLVAVIAQFHIAGVLMDRWIARTAQATRVRRIILVTSMLTSLAVVGAAYANSITVAITFLSIGAAGLAVSVPAGSSIVSLIAPHGYTGTMGGIVNFIANTIGIAAPIVTGIVVDSTGSFAWAFIVTGFVIVAGIISYTLVLGRMDRIDPPPAAVTAARP
ncbi:MFS transporter [Saccharopolyspora pogona]|uniref:MFS transporter n=1 Tax=Saccharopolyspora pogona TaxID=333966 RepID=UPI0016829F07|nr:MFS transporter [Saccharopolyspora pogona]